MSFVVGRTNLRMAARDGSYPSSTASGSTRVDDYYARHEVSGQSAVSVARLPPPTISFFYAVASLSRLHHVGASFDSNQNHHNYTGRRTEWSPLFGSRPHCRPRSASSTALSLWACNSANWNNWPDTKHEVSEPSHSAKSY